MNFRRNCRTITFLFITIWFTILFWHRAAYLDILKRTFNSRISIDILSNNVTERLHLYFSVSKNSCIIILKQKTGRLGNLMFKFATAYGLARTHGCKLYIDEPYLTILNATFIIDITHLSISESKYFNLTGITYRDNTACHYFEDLMVPNSTRYMELTGYWQAYRYFINYTDELRQKFTFRPIIIQEIAPFLLKELKWQRSCLSNCTGRYRNESTLSHIETYVENQLNLKNELRRSSFTLVGVHWRRGDFLRQDKQTYGHTVSSLSYIDKAMNYFLHKYADVLFIITSDDKSYCVEIFKNNSRVIITPNNFTPEHDLATLTVCHHTIVTSGSFGWFAGYLAGGNVLYDKLSPAKQSALERDCPPSQYYPPQFLPMKR